MFGGNNNSVITPCVGQCNLDDNNGCKGCFRSAHEINTWVDMSEDEKISIVIRCKKQIAASASTQSE